MNKPMISEIRRSASLVRMLTLLACVGLAIVLARPATVAGLRNLGFLFLVRGVMSKQPNDLLPARILMEAAEGLGEAPLDRQIALIAQFSGNESEAIPRWSRYIEKHPSDELGVLFLGRALMASGEYDAAQQLWGAPGQEALIPLQGLDCFARNDLPCATEWALRALQVRPWDGRTWYLLRAVVAHVCSPRDRTELEIVLCGRVHELDYTRDGISPCRTMECHVERGRFLLYTWGQFDLAFLELQKARAQLGDKQPDRQLMLDLVYASYKTQRWESVKRYAAAIQPPAPVGAYTCWAEALLSLEETAVAVSVLERAVMYYPGSQQLHVLLEQAKGSLQQEQ